MFDPLQILLSNGELYRRPHHGALGKEKAGRMRVAGIVSMYVVVVLCCGLQWLIQAFTWGMGMGVAGAQQVVFVAAILGSPTLVTVSVLAFFQRRGMVASAALFAGGVLLANAGMISLLAASPMESDWYQYGWIDRSPDQAGQLFLGLGAAAIAAGFWLSLRGRPRSASDPD